MLEQWYKLVRYGNNSSQDGKGTRDGFEERTNICDICICKVKIYIRDKINCKYNVCPIMVQQYVDFFLVC